MIGILEAGRPADKLIGQHGSFTDMLSRLLRGADPSLSFTSYAVRDHDFPTGPTACDGWVITGSAHSAYEDLPWIRRLEVFLRDSVAIGIPVVGICFGHQILAQALGGTVEKSERGWGLGLHDYALVTRPPWMDGFADDRISLPAIHQDQVVALPPDATVIAGSAFCPYAALAYGDRALSFQAHPEFDLAFEADLIRSLSGSRLDPDRARAALQGVTAPQATTDAGAVAAWIARFLACAG
ncbi:MAG: type 1 glutamine amidotransferase [Azospirillaceae bacterium]|nr:type 1 glutamine amidotransferase [Azospirillaceae bacterium]